MRHLKRAASSDFLHLTQLSFYLGVINWEQFLDRIAALREMTSARDPVHTFARRVIALENWFDDRPWQDAQASGKSEVRSVPTGSEGDDYTIQLIIKHIKLLGAWDFHQNDEDWFPSVPHGHNEEKGRKLDAYLGWTWTTTKKSQCTGRVPRKAIIDLWNHDPFRELAAKAIDFYLTHFPNYSGWKTKTPRTLPRKRKNST